MPFSHLIFCHSFLCLFCSALLDSLLSLWTALISFKLFLKKMLFIFQRENKEGRKRGRETLMCERNNNRLPRACPQLGIWPKTQACALIENQTSNLLVHRLVINPLSHTSHGLVISSFAQMLPNQ